MALSVTKRALVALRGVLDRREVLGSQALRLTAGIDRKLAFVLDRPQEDDVIVGFDDVTVMIVGSRLNTQLDGLILDLHETSDGPMWTLTNKDSGVARREP
jgi:hypothetical protein